MFCKYKRWQMIKYNIYDDDDDGDDGDDADDDGDDKKEPWA